jgi:hypothetical protein
MARLGSGKRQGCLCAAGCSCAARFRLAERVTSPRSRLLGSSRVCDSGAARAFEHGRGEATATRCKCKPRSRGRSNCTPHSDLCAARPGQTVIDFSAVSMRRRLREHTGPGKIALCAECIAGCIPNPERCWVLSPKCCVHWIRRTGSRRGVPMDSVRH